MTKTISLPKTLTFAVVSQLAISTVSFGMENMDLSNAIDLAPKTKTIEQVKGQDSVIIDIENQLPVQQLSASQILNNKGEEASTALKMIDTGIKYGIVAGGIAAGAGLAWFYGPALAFTAAYKTSIFLATAATTPTWYAYKFVVEPAAIDAGIYFATSPLVHAGIGAAASGIGYGFGKIGCAAYEGLKYTVGTGIPTATRYTAETAYSISSTVGTATYNAGTYIAPKISTTVNTIASTVASTASSFAASAWNWWSGAKTVASVLPV